MGYFGINTSENILGEIKNGLNDRYACLNILLKSQTTTIYVSFLYLLINALITIYERRENSGLKK
jgi:hypothetical protein